MLHLLVCPSYPHTPDGEPLLAGEGLEEMLPLDVVCDKVSFVVGPGKSQYPTTQKRE